MVKAIILAVSIFLFAMLISMLIFRHIIKTKLDRDNSTGKYRPPLMEEVIKF